MYLVAPDSFKGTFTSAEVAAAMARGLERVGAEAQVCPLADGGEGTMEVLVGALGGELVDAAAHDPLGRAIEARFGLLANGSAIVETAEASGLGHVAEGERDAEAASSAGTGELIAAAAAAGARRVLVAAGGSATTDGGAGALEAIARGGGLRGAELAVLCDVRTAFERAPSVYGPQKGADPAAVARLEARLGELARNFKQDPRGVPMTGAAGGLAGGLWAQLGAELMPGAEAALDAVGFDRRLAAAERMLTGEGRLDSQSVEGKLVGVIAQRCLATGKPLDVVAGTIELDDAAARLSAHSVRAAATIAEIETAAEAIAGEASSDDQVRKRCPGRPARRG
ncbi:MAG: glycerate kinase [bacterium]